jgi:GAF domain-containing protein
MCPTAFAAERRIVMENHKKTPQFLSLFMKVTQNITSCLQPDRIFDLIATELVALLDIDGVTVRLIDSSGEKLELKAASGLSRSYLNRGAIDAEEPVFKALQGEPIFIENALEDNRITFKEETRKEGIKSVLVVPIPIRGKVMGVLRLLTKKTYRFEPPEIKFVSSLAEQCGIAIENAQMFAKQETQLSYFILLHELGKLINSRGNLNDILAFIVTRLPEVMGLKAATIRFFESKGKLALKAAHGLSNTYLERGSLDKEPATYYLMQGEPVIIRDAKADVHTVYHKEARSEGIGSILAVPIGMGADSIGILRLLSSDIRHFTDADVRFAMTVGEQSAMAIKDVISRESV